MKIPKFTVNDIVIRSIKYNNDEKGFSLLDSNIHSLPNGIPNTNTTNTTTKIPSAISWLIEKNRINENEIELNSYS